MLRTHREAAGLTQQELSTRAGISTAAVRDLEQGRTRRPHPRTTRALATALRLDATDAEQLHREARGVRQTVRPPASLAAEPTADAEINILVLGPLVVRVGGVPVTVGAEQPRKAAAREAETHVRQNHAAAITDRHVFER